MSDVKYKFNLNHYTRTAPGEAYITKGFVVEIDALHIFTATV